MVTSYILSMYKGSHVTPCQSFWLRHASRHALVWDMGSLVDFSSCEGERFETLPSVFVASLPGFVLASPEAAYEYGSLQSLTVLNPDDL